MAEHTVHVSYIDPNKDRFGTDESGAVFRKRSTRRAVVKVEATSKSQAINKAGAKISRMGLTVRDITHHSVSEGSLPFHKRVEPTFDAPKPKSKGNERIEPTFDAPKNSSTSSTSKKSSSGPAMKDDEVRMSITHHITPIRGTSNKPRSLYKVHKVEKDGSSQEIFSSQHLETIHRFVLGGVRHVKDAAPETPVHVHDKAKTGYSKWIDSTRPHGKKMTVPDHTISENDHNRGSSNMTTNTKYAPKKLKDILPPKPSKKWNELDGNTEDEKKIVSDFRKNAVLHPDPAGNGDDVFKASNIVHNGKPVLPGDDEEKYAKNNGKVANLEAYKLPGSLWDITEAAGPMATSYFSSPITGRDTDFHWATKHVAPQGSKIRRVGKDAEITHPDGTIHHIEDGAVHQSQKKYDTKPEGKTHAHAGKYTVIKKTAPYGNHSKTLTHFVSSKIASNTMGAKSTTSDEKWAHEFHNKEHASNYTNVMHHAIDKLGDGGHPTRYEIHNKRSPGEIKKSQIAHKAARAEYMAAVDKHKFDHSHPEVQKRYHKVLSTIHPSMRS